MFINLKYCYSVFYIFVSTIFISQISYSSPATENHLHTLQADTTDTLEWSPPRFEEREKERHELVASLGPRITNTKVIDAMRHVPRHLFVPKRMSKFAYQNRPLPIGHDQTISQPFIVAYMTQLLDLQAGEKVLEIGTGSGYQAAVLSEITAEVYTIEIVEALGKQARAHFDSLGYGVIKTKIGDGYKGWATYAPFDAIVLTAAPPEIPQPLINQLKPGGVLVAPVGATDRTQVITKLTKLQNGEIKREQKLPVRFVPMTGEAQDQ